MSIYPTLQEVENADRYTLCKWFRFLPSPISKEQTTINNRIFDRWQEAGGFTVEISEKLGWDDPYSSQ